MSRLVWVNSDSTVLVERFEDGSVLNVATRPDSDEVWSPPMKCHADAETAKIMSFAAEVTDAVTERLETPEVVPSSLISTAVNLCRNALGDDYLWAATEALREQLSDLLDDRFPWSQLP